MALKNTSRYSAEQGLSWYNEGKIRLLGAKTFYIILHKKENQHKDNNLLDQFRIWLMMY